MKGSVDLFPSVASNKECIGCEVDVPQSSNTNILSNVKKPWNNDHHIEQNAKTATIRNEYESTAWRRELWKIKLHLLDEERFVTSHVLTPKALLIVRSLLTAYAVTILIAHLATQFDNGNWLRFITNLSYAALTCYLIVATVCTAIYVKRGGENNPDSVVRMPQWLHTLLWVVYEIIFCYKIIVPLFYWAFLSAGAPPWSESFNAWINISVHGLDFVVMIIEFAINRHVFVFGHAYFLIGMTLVYVIVLNIIYYANN
eukprot:Ihof_evm1s62 gene=Ihof_evmTU1s62